MITSILEFKKIYETVVRVPETIELQTGIDYKNINWSDLEIVDLDGNGNDVAYLGVHIPNENNKYNKGIIVDIKVVYDGLYLIDILMDINLQGFGLGYKIYKKIISEFGHIFSLYSKRVNDDAIPKIWSKLKNDNMFEVHSNNLGEICILKSLSDIDKQELLNKFNNI